jgi:hypothetical protein
VFKSERNTDLEGMLLRSPWLVVEVEVLRGVEFGGFVITVVQTQSIKILT